VSGPTNPDSPPPEVPEEFAAAYWAAYERALAAQSGGPQRREDPPEEREPETPRRSREGVDDSPTWFEEVLDSGWFVPLLLGVLALLLILGAYAVGRSFAGQVAGDASPDSEPSVVLGEGGSGGDEQPVTDQKADAAAQLSSVSRIIVTGPSLASSTVMSAPKTPRSTCVPCSSRLAQTAS
jgi:hypothetical protein